MLVHDSVLVHDSYHHVLVHDSLIGLPAANGPGAAFLTVEDGAMAVEFTCNDHWDAWLGDALRLAAARLHDRTAAEDAVQEACVDALRAAPRLTGGVDGARAWFMTLVINRCRMAQRTARRRRVRPAATAPDEAVAPAAPDHDLGEALRAALGTLPEHERTAIELRFLAGLDFAAIARVLRRPEKTVRSRVDRGLVRLRSVVERVGLAAGGPAALGLLLSALPAPTPAAEFIARVHALPPPSPAVAVAPAATPAAMLVAAGLAAATLMAAWAWTRPMSLLPEPPVAQAAAADAVPVIMPEPPVRRFGKAPFVADGFVGGVALSPDGTRVLWWSGMARAGAGMFRLPGGEGQVFPALRGRGVQAGAWLDDQRVLLMTLHHVQQPEPPCLLTLDVASGQVSEQPMPPGTRPYSITRSPDGRWLGLATVPADYQEPGVANTHLAVIDTTTATITARLPLTTPGSGASIYAPLIGTDVVAAKLSGSTLNLAPGANPSSAADLVIADRASGEERRRVRLPWAGFQIDGTRWLGDAILVTARPGGVLESMVIDPRDGRSTRHRGWLLDQGAPRWRLLDNRIERDDGPPIALDMNTKDILETSVDHRWVALAHQWRVQVVERSSGRLLAGASGLWAAPDGVAWTPSGLVLQEGGCLALLRDGVLEPWTDGRFFQWQPLAAGGDRVAVGSGDGAVRLLDTGSGALRATLRNAGYTPGHVAIAPDGSRLLVDWDARHEGRELLLHDGNDGEVVARLAVQPEDGFRSLGVAWTADVETLFLATGSAQASGAYDATNGERRWEACDPALQPLRWVSDLVPAGTRWAVARIAPERGRTGVPGQAYRLRLDDGVAELELPDPGSPAFATADGDRVAGARGVVGLADGKLRRLWPAAVVVSPSGTRAAWLEDGTLVLDDTRDGALTCRIDLPQDALGAETPHLTWSRDEQQIALHWTDAPETLVIDGYAPAIAMTTADALAALTEETWPAAVGALARQGALALPALDTRLPDARSVAVLERLALGGVADADRRLQALISHPVAGAAACDALLRLVAARRPAHHPQLPRPVPAAQNNDDF